jgi:hypothetical protein
MSLSTARRAVGTLAVAAAIFLAGCQSDVMKGYIGQPLESVIIDYGPPTSVIELGRGQRALPVEQDIDKRRRRLDKRRVSRHQARHAL